VEKNALAHPLKIKTDEDSGNGLNDLEFDDAESIKESETEGTKTIKFKRASPGEMILENIEFGKIYGRGARSWWGYQEKDQARGYYLRVKAGTRSRRKNRNGELILDKNITAAINEAAQKQISSKVSNI
jgi:hypothetical protein